MEYDPNVCNYDDYDHEYTPSLDHQSQEVNEHNYHESYIDESGTMDDLTHDMDSTHIDGHIQSLTLLPDTVCNFLQLFTTLISSFLAINIYDDVISQQDFVSPNTSLS